MNYNDFLEAKRIVAKPAGFNVDPGDLHSQLFDFQRYTVARSLNLGKAAIFAQTGLGKTIQQIAWAQEVSDRRDAVLLLAPLAVARQTATSEAAKFGVKVNFCESDADVTGGINVTNYEKLHKFTSSKFAGIICDEASILKNPEGFTAQALAEFAANIPYRLACTATPAANDFDEFGMIAEYLGIMSRSEMLATFFTHDGGDTSSWILMGHGERRFWEWVCSWATAFKTPADLGFDGKAYNLLPITDHHHHVESPLQPTDGKLLYEIKNMNDRRRARRSCTQERVAAIASLVNTSSENSLIFCDYNDEGDLLEQAIDGAVQVAGKNTAEKKAQAALDFAEGKIQRLVVKGSMFGAGLNLQYHCHNIYFAGIDDSWEKLHQCTSRVHRYGQTKQVSRHFAYSHHEQVVWDNLHRKRTQDTKMWREFARCMKKAIGLTDVATQRFEVEYNPQVEINIPQWLRSEAAA